MGSGAPAPDALCFAEGEEHATALLRSPRDDGAGGLALVRLDRRDRPQAVTFESVEADVLGRIDEQLYLFGSSGVTLVREGDGGDRQAPAFRLDRFFAEEVMASVRAVAVAGRMALVAGLDADQGVVVRSYDGLTFSTVEPVPGDRPGPVAEVTVAAAADRFLLAARDESGLWLGEVSRGELRWRPKQALPPGDPALCIVDLRSRPAVILLGDAAPAQRNLLRIPFADPGEAAEPMLLAEIPEGSAARLVGRDRSRGQAQRSGQEGVLIAAGDRIRAYDVADGSLLERPPMVLAAWHSHWSRFERPLGIQLALFVLLGILAGPRRRRAAAQEGPEGVRESWPMPAPYWRRGLAFLFDLAFLLMASVWLFITVLDPESLAFVEFAWMSAATSTDPAAEALVSGGLATGLLADARWLFVMLFTAAAALFDLALGRSPGKALFGLRVLRLDGGRPDLAMATTRSLMLLLDWLWSLGLLGLTLVLITRRRQRLGDLLAGTVVTRDGAPMVSHTRPVARDTQDR